MDIEQLMDTYSLGHMTRAEFLRALQSNGIDYYDAVALVNLLDEDLPAKTVDGAGLRLR